MLEIKDSVQTYQSVAYQFSIVVVLSCFTMSGQFDPNVTMYSDEASMVNSSNGETTLPMITPQVVEEPETGLVPQAQAQPVAMLFGDQRIFVSAPQYPWHAQGAVGADDEAKHHIDALA